MGPPTGTVAYQQQHGGGGNYANAAATGNNKERISQSSTSHKISAKHFSTFGSSPPSAAAAGNDDRRNCAFCNHSLGEEAIVAMNRLWHPDHFLCNGCKKPIRQTFQSADNHAYCVHCFGERFNPKCAGCHEILIDTCLLALDKHWHPRCFTCNCCRRPLPNGEYYLVDDKPYDLDCHWEKRLDKRTQIAKERQQFADF